MAKSNQYIKDKHLPLLRQKTALLASYPGSKCIIDAGTLMWSGDVRPTTISRDYSIILSYRLWERPKVFVYGSSLRKLDAANFPHNYSVDENSKMVEMCLYRYREFSGYKYLAKTIIPWAIEWLYFYEIWLATGEWCGGGEHPDIGKDKEDEETCAEG